MSNKSRDGDDRIDSLDVVQIEETDRGKDPFPEIRKERVELHPLDVVDGKEEDQ